MRNTFITSETWYPLYIQPTFEGQVLCQGTAFICRTPNGFALLTNRHNFTCRSQVDNQPLYPHGGVPDGIRVWHHSARERGAFIAVDYKILFEDAALWTEHPVLGKDADIAAIGIEPSDEIDLHPVDLTAPGDPLYLQPGETCSVIGYPFGIGGGKTFPIWATGFIATEPELSFEGRPVFLIDCRSREGQSGSPVFASRVGTYFLSSLKHPMAGMISEFLGIYSGRINRESDLGKVWRREAIKELLLNMPLFTPIRQETAS